MTLSPQQYTLPFAPQDSYAAEDFIPMPENQEAYAFLESWPHWPGYGVVLEGPRGAGKSHLAALWASRSKAALCVPTQDLPLRGSLVLDDFDHFMDDEALFHALNRVKEQGAFLLLTVPEGWRADQRTLPDLKSRLKALPHLYLRAPGDALLQMMLAKHLAAAGLRLSASQKNYSLQHLERSGSAVRHFARSLHQALLERPQRITQHLLRSLCEANEVHNETISLDPRA